MISMKTITCKFTSYALKTGMHFYVKLGKIQEFADLSVSTSFKNHRIIAETIQVYDVIEWILNKK